VTAETPPNPNQSAQGAPLRGHHDDAQSLDYLRHGGAATPIGELFKTRALKTPIDRMTRRVSGKRSYTVSRRKRGRYIYARSAQGRYDDIALDATARQAAPMQPQRDHTHTALAIEKGDLQRKVRVRKTANLVVFAVDASWSMAAAERMEATKGAIMSLLVDAYQKRDRVCMISFQRDRAQLVLPPTSSVEMAQKALREIPVGGKTPLSAGLLLAFQVIEREQRQDSEIVPLMILLTDGAGNVSVTGMPPREEALMIAGLFGEKRIRAVVVNTEHETLDRGLARELADRLDAPCYSLVEIRAETLYETVRRELKS
jgi:magnesium chelatase subunit D